MNEENNKNLEEKLNQLEARNQRLEADISILASRSQLLAPDSFQSDDEIDLKELWNAIWSGKWLIIGITFVFSVASVLYALSLPDEYKSTAVLAPASSSSSSQLSKLAGQFGGLASLAGINLSGGGAEDKTVIAMEIMKTWGFLEKFIVDNHIEVEVFAADGWDRATDTLRINPDLYDVEAQKWVRDYHPSRGQKLQPSGWELYESFKEKVTVSQDKTSGLISISVEFFSPKIAKQWTEKLIRAINAHIQTQERKEATKSISYLNNKINETNIADMQGVFYQLIEEQTKTLMLAEVSEEYVFKTISAPKVAEEKTSPKRALITVLATILGGMFSVLVTLLRYFVNK
ncbi:MAG: Wzz/FepE/Etk N-terminal domain-containing protein [Kangiellaceae bacterium]